MQQTFTKEEFLKVMNDIVLKFNNSGAIERMVPRNINSTNLNLLTKDLEYTKVSSDTNSLTRVFIIYIWKVLSEPMYDLLDRGGKRWRPALCFFVAECFGHNLVFTWLWG